MDSPHTQDHFSPKKSNFRPKKVQFSRFLVKHALRWPPGIFPFFCSYSVKYAFLVETCIQRKFRMVILAMIKTKKVKKRHIIYPTGYFSVILSRFFGHFELFFGFLQLFRQICISSRDMYTKKVPNDHFSHDKTKKSEKNPIIDPMGVKKWFWRLFWVKKNRKK